MFYRNVAALNTKSKWHVLIKDLLRNIDKLFHYTFHLWIKTSQLRIIHPRYNEKSSDSNEAQAGTVLYFKCTERSFEFVFSSKFLITKPLVLTVANCKTATEPTSLFRSERLSSAMSTMLRELQSESFFVVRLQDVDEGVVRKRPCPWQRSKTYTRNEWFVCHFSFTSNEY